MSAPQNDTTMEVISNRLARLEAERDYLRKCLQIMADTDFGDYHSDWLREMAKETLRGELKEEQA